MINIIDMSQCRKIYVNDIAAKDSTSINMLKRYGQPELVQDSLLNNFTNEIENNWTYYGDTGNAFRNVRGRTYTHSHITARIFNNGRYGSKAITLHGDKESVSGLTQLLRLAQIVDIAELTETK